MEGKKVNKKLLKTTFLLSVFINFLVLPIPGVSVFAQETETRVTIKGLISNIADVGEYVSSQTYLQLYPCETSDKVDFRMNAKGLPESAPGQKDKVHYLDRLKRLVPQSTLPGIRPSVFGNFMFFKIRGLEPGKCYKICAMMMDQPYPGMIALTTEDGKIFEFVVPEAEPESGAAEKRHDIVVDLMKQALNIPTLQQP